LPVTCDETYVLSVSDSDPFAQLCKITNDVIHRTGIHVHNQLQCHQRRIEPQP